MPRKKAGMKSASLGVGLEDNTNTIIGQNGEKIIKKDLLQNLHNIEGLPEKYKYLFQDDDFLTEVSAYAKSLTVLKNKAYNRKPDGDLISKDFNFAESPEYWQWKSLVNRFGGTHNVTTMAVMAAKEKSESLKKQDNSELLWLMGSGAPELNSSATFAYTVKTAARTA